MSSHNVDDLLTIGREVTTENANVTTQPATPEESNTEYNTPDEKAEIQDEVTTETESNTDNENVSEENKGKDDYGNEVKQRLYTEEEVNERINQRVRDRLARAERNAATQQQAQPTLQQDDNPESWHQQLETIIENTVSKLGQKQAQIAQQEREYQIQQEFESRFTTGMEKFPDYKDVVGTQPITDAMVIGARSIQNPAAFFYAASKRAPKELERISKMTDPYAQIAEIGRLEERMRQKTSKTEAPRPVSRTPEDTGFKQPIKQRKQTIEDMIAADTAKKLAKLNNQRRR